MAVRRAGQAAHVTQHAWPWDRTVQASSLSARQTLRSQRGLTAQEEPGPCAASAAYNVYQSARPMRRAPSIMPAYEELGQYGQVRGTTQALLQMCT